MTGRKNASHSVTVESFSTGYQGIMLIVSRICEKEIRFSKEKYGKEKLSTSDS